MGCCGTCNTNSFLHKTRDTGIDNNSSSSNIEDEKYTFIKEVSQCFSGKVFKAKSNKTKNIYIIKIIEERKKLKYGIIEALILGKCNHPNIINLKQVYKERKGNEISLNIATVLANDGDLFQKLIENENYDEETLLFWLMQICLGLSYLHKKHIIHRDIKPKNIFVNKNGLIKIGDLGFAKHINNKDELKKKQTILGTDKYMSPEMKEGIYDSKTDIYSLGQTFQDFIEGKTNYSDSFKNLINSLIEEKPSKRPSADEILNNSLIKNKMKRFLEVHNFKNSLAYQIYNKIKDQKINNEDSFFKIVKKERKNLYKVENINKETEIENKELVEKDLDILMCFIYKRINGKY